MKTENNLRTDPIGSLVLRIAIPSMLAQFVSVLYSIVDRMYIGNIPVIGEGALAGVGVCGPIVTLVGSFAYLIGYGGAPLMSIRMGEGDQKEAERILSNCFVVLGGLSLVLTVLTLLVKDYLLMWFGASPGIFDYANSYITLYFLGTPFALLSTGMNQFIICQGYAKTGMKSVMLGAVLNIVLDPIFIFLLGLGVQGAAIATVLSQLASCVYVLRFLFSRRPPVRIRRMPCSLPIIRWVLTLGLTPFLIIAFDNIVLIALNAVLQQHGGARGDMLIACSTIVQSFMLLITMPLGGITGGTQTILSYNYGARQSRRVLEAQRWILLLGVVFTAIMFAVARLIPTVFVHLFTQNPEYVDLSVRSIHIFTLGVTPLALQYMVVDGYTALSLPALSISLSMFRKVLYLGSVFVLPYLVDVSLIFMAEPISDFIGAAVSGIVYFLTIRRLLREREMAPGRS